MDVKEERLCRFCLDVVEQEYEVIDETIKEILDVLELKMNLDVSENPVMCQSCSETLNTCHDFSLICSRAEDVSVKKETPSELGDVCEEETSVDENCNVCRLCMTLPAANNWVSTDDFIKDGTFGEIWSVVRPILNVAIVKNCVICTNCTANLKRSFNFVQKCWYTEEKINTYCQHKGTNSEGKVRLSSVQYFLIEGVPAEVLSEPCNDSLKSEELQIKQEAVSLDENFLPRPYVGVYLCDESYNKSDLDAELSKDETCSFKPISEKRPRFHENNSEAKTHKSTNPKDPSEGRKYRCSECTYKTNRKDLLKHHMLVHKDSSEVKMYKCPLCPHETKYKNNLKAHTITHNVATESNMHKCLVCAFETYHGHQLRQHMLVHKHPSSYKCPTCRYETKREYYFISHTLTHKHAASVKIYKCTKCAFQTVVERSLNKHMFVQHKHSSEDKVNKPTFKPKFVQTLVNHVAAANKNVLEIDMYQCPECDFRTEVSSDLTPHLSLHEDAPEVGVHKCTLCIYKTKQRKNLNSHLQLHKGTTEADMYKCTLCSYETKLEDSLKAHMVTHKEVSDIELYKFTMYRCKVCSYESPLKHRLKAHTPTHWDAEEMDRTTVRQVALTASLR